MTEIGATLREARMRAHIDISEVEAQTKIRAKYLRALEDEEWNMLPGPVYVRSFLRTYADYLGLDSRLLLDEFKRRYDQPVGQESHAVPSRRPERRRGDERLGGAGGGATPTGGGVLAAVFSPVGVIVVALVVIVAALYVIGSHGNGSGGGSVKTITPSTVIGGKTGTGRARHRHRHHPAKKRKRSNKTTTSTGTGTLTTGTSTTPVTSATLSIVPTAIVWLCVENGAGKTIYTGEYSPGQAVPVARSSELLVTLGNDHLTMDVNGQPYTPPVGAAIGLKITPQGVTTLTSALPTCS
ncbi:MAG: RodZ domain-containing protein [Solirubrobacteraceae bacterium]